MGTLIQETGKASHDPLIEFSALISRQNTLEFDKAVAKSDVVVDVSAPKATTAFLGQLMRKKMKIPYVIGCTGWSDSELADVQRYAEQTCVVMAPNFSAGMTLVANWIEKAAPILKKFGYLVSIKETHHAQKKDAPSGTAKSVSEKLMAAEVPVTVMSVREGEVVGKHEFEIVGPGDRFVIVHEATSRSVFAQGAILAAAWAAKSGEEESVGIFAMTDVLEIGLVNF